MDKLRTARRLKGDMAELYKQYARLSKYADQADDTCKAICETVVAKAGLAIHSPLRDDAFQLSQNLLIYGGYYPLPEIDFTKDIPIGEIWDHTKALKLQLELYQNPGHKQEIMDLLALYVQAFLPQFTANGSPLGYAQFVDMHHAPAATIDWLIPFAMRKVHEENLFKRLGHTLFNNICQASGINPDRDDPDKVKQLWASMCQGITREVMTTLYLNQTPFEDFWLKPIRFSIPEKTRFEHMHIVAGSGHGKTQTLQNLILSDLSKVATGERSVIVIDSQGDMINNLLARAAVGELSDRVVLIYPKDIKYPPALNLFDFGLDRVGRYNEVQQETLINGAISMYEYVFGALLGASLTQRQGVIFRYLARLLMVVPGATIHTLMDFMQTPESVRPYLAKVDDPNTRKFFETDFFSKAFDDTRQQIRTRLWGILSNRTLARMFESKRNKVNLFDSMNKGSLILIYTAKELLKQEGCEIFGRFFIALIAQAAQERASMADERRTPTFVYIDEAHDYFDESIESLLVQARKYNVGLVIANQFLDQFDRRLLSAVKTNTAIKMVGGLSNDDARDFAREMNCEREFIQSMQKHERFTQFACMVKNHPASPLRLTVPLGLLEEQPKINPYVWKALIERNRELYCRDLSAENPDEPDLPPDDDSPLGDPDPL
jgi:hypothetical protein